DRRLGGSFLCDNPPPPRDLALFHQPLPVPDCLCRLCHYAVSLCGSPFHHPVGCGGSEDQPGLSPGRRGHSGSHHHCLYLLCLLGVPWKSRSEPRLPLSRKTGGGAASGCCCSCWPGSDWSRRLLIYCA